jgi:hypothetical protein
VVIGLSKHWCDSESLLTPVCHLPAMACTQKPLPPAQRAALPTLRPLRGMLPMWVGGAPFVPFQAARLPSKSRASHPVPLASLTSAAHCVLAS